MSTVIVAGAAGLVGLENVQRFARKGFRAANRRKLIKPARPIAMPAFPESILITGGAGFVGGNLAVFLKRCHAQTRVIAMDNLHRPGSELNLPRLREAGVEFAKGDIRSAEQFPAGPFEAIIECSAEPSCWPVTPARRTI